MKKMLAAAAVIFAAMSVYAAAVQPTARPERNDLDSEVSIRRLYEQFTAAWNRHDPAAMAKMWTRHGDHVEPDGRRAEGREAVEKLFAQEQEGAFKESTLSLTVDSVWMITPNVALVNGSYSVEGVRTPDGKELALRKGQLTSVLLQDKGEWYVAASRAMIPITLPWRPQG